MAGMTNVAVAMMMTGSSVLWRNCCIWKLTTSPRNVRWMNIMTTFMMVRTMNAMSVVTLYIQVTYDRMKTDSAIIANITRQCWTSFAVRTVQHSLPFIIRYSAVMNISSMKIVALLGILPSYSDRTLRALNLKGTRQSSTTHVENPAFRPIKWNTQL